MPTVTQQTYFRRLLDRLYPQRYQRYGTATAATTAGLTDAPAFTTSFTQTSHLIGAWMRVSGTTAGGTQYAKIASVSAAGVVTWDRALTAPTGVITWEITYERHPQNIERFLDMVLVNTYVPRMYPLSSHIITNDDNDMESTATITGMWSNSSGTLTKETSIVFPTGAQSLKVVAAASPGYAYLAADIPVTQGVQYWASVLESTASGDSAEFRIVNVDDSNAAIENATTDEVTWNELSFYFTPPTGCERINAFLISTTNTDISYWDDLSIIDTYQTIFPTPSWFTKPKQLIAAFEMPRGTAGPAGDNDFRTLERSLRPLPREVATASLLANQEVLLDVSGFGGSRRYIYAMCPLSALSANTGTSYAEVDVVAENAHWMLEHPEDIKYLARLRERTLISYHRVPEPPNMAYPA